jgi:hypothetical protein
MVPRHPQWSRSAAVEQSELGSALKKGYRTVPDREGFVPLDRPAFAPKPQRPQRPR